MRKIYYSPFYNSDNEYCNRMKDFLSSYGMVLPFEKSNFLKVFFNIGTDDYIFFNWIENSMVKNRRFSIVGFLKVFLFLVFFRMRSSNIVFVKHNNYPHNCCKKDIKKSIWAVSVFEKICNRVIVHSIPDLRKNYFYIPHPLYKEVSEPELINCVNDKYLVFGRIVPYKKIEELIVSFPKDKKLIIAGACDDKLYLEKLIGLCDKKLNIEIIPRFLNHDEIKALAEESSGILITHNDDDMIVSGTFFYAMTLRSKVYALETPFFKWAESKMGKKYITTFRNLNELSDEILKGVEVEKDNSGFTMIDLFGEKSVHSYMSNFFNGSKV